ncbi:MAG: maleylpyruvate isomerase N-terminal domain-containing protein [Ilumatobacteraceae bacterium]
MAIDLGAIYRASRLRVADLADDSVADQPVPATPAWNVHDVVAHLAGVLGDVAAGNLDGAATDPWTAAQVDRGRDKPLSRVVAEAFGVCGPVTGRPVTHALSHHSVWSLRPRYGASGFIRCSRVSAGR